MEGTPPCGRSARRGPPDRGEGRSGEASAPGPSTGPAVGGGRLPRDRDERHRRPRPRHPDGGPGRRRDGRNAPPRTGERAAPAAGAGPPRSARARDGAGRGDRRRRPQGDAHQRVQCQGRHLGRVRQRCRDRVHRPQPAQQHADPVDGGRQRDGPPRRPAARRRDPAHRQGLRPAVDGGDGRVRGRGRGVRAAPGQPGQGGEQLQGVRGHAAQQRGKDGPGPVPGALRPDRGPPRVPRVRAHDGVAPRREKAVGVAGESPRPHRL